MDRGLQQDFFDLLVSNVVARPHLAPRVAGDEVSLDRRNIRPMQMIRLSSPIWRAPGRDAFHDPHSSFRLELQRLYARLESVSRQSDGWSGERRCARGRW